MQVLGWVAFLSSDAGLFFFFQAEDGIRDLIVTGVQTCALPILGVDTRLALFGCALAWLQKSAHPNSARRVSTPSARRSERSEYGYEIAMAESRTRFARSALPNGNANAAPAR